ncbi:MAG: hypothetical protein ACRD8U_04315 [Pyrinomonadaceae bacterium]
MIAFDTSTIVLTLDPDKARPPTDPATGLLLTNCKRRVDYLISKLDQANEGILIPTPILSEYLVRAGPNRNEYIKKFLSSKNFVVGAFDQRAAIELALLNDPDLNAGVVLDDKTTWAKIKFDRQIVSIAKVHGVSCIYAGDNGLATCARANGIRAVMTWELPEPPEAPEDKQDVLPFPK